MTIRRLSSRILVGTLLVGLGVIGSVAASGTKQTAPAITYDVIIRGGTIVDGTGRPAYVGDVAIKGGHIAAVGALPPSQARRIIDAKGLVVSPGFINTHSHADPRAVSTAVNMLTQGVTTEFMNADGYGTSGLDAQLADFAKNGLAENIGGYAGFNTAWAEVVGETDRAPIDDEITRMRAIITANLEQGAWGVSAGLDYKPGYFASARDVVRVVSVAAPWRTHFTNHDRLRPEQNFSSLAGVRETIEIAEAAGLLPLATHIKSQGVEQGAAGNILALLDASTVRGQTGAADVYPYLAGQTELTALLLPAWALEGGRPAMLARFKDEGLRRKAAGEAERAIELRFRNASNILDVESGRTVADWMAEWKVAPGKAVIRLAEEKPREAILTFGSESDLESFLRYNAAAITCDCGASIERRGHPRTYGTFPRFLGVYVRERHLVSLEDAIRKMTGLSAQIVGASDRGLLAPGMAADITIFDPATVIDHATYDRPTELSTGVTSVIVNGVIALDAGKPTGAKGGTLLRRDRHMPSRPLAPFGAGQLAVSAQLADRSAGTLTVKAALTQRPAVRFASGKLEIRTGTQTWRLSGAGILQTTADWSSVTATLVDGQGGLEPVVLTLDGNSASPAGQRVIVKFRGVNFAG